MSAVRILRKRLWYLLIESDTKTLELWLLLAKVGLGLWLLSPWTNPFSFGSGYRMMASIMSETYWGVLMVVTGLVHLLALLKPNSLVRRVALVVALFIWLFVALSFGASNPMGTGLLTYAMLAFGCFLCMMRPGWKP